MMTTFITHPSVRMKGTEANYQPEQCFDGGCSDHPPHMHCPFCVKSDCYTDPVILKAHYRVKHVDKGIEFAGLKILRCCAQCEIVGVIKGEKRFKGAHWHCYKCRNGFNRRDEAIKHYKTHFRNPQTTFQIQIAQDTNQPVTQGFETEEAAASIPVDTFTVHSVNSSLPVVTSYTQAGSEMMHRGVEDMVTGVGAIETVGLSDTQTIMIIQDETHGMHDTSQDLSNASSLVNDSGDDHTGDPGLEMQVKELQQRVVQLEQELLDRDAVIRDLQAKVNASKAREQELMDQLSVPTSESLQELCTSLQTQHSELLRNQLKLVQQAVLKNHNQNKKSQTKMIIINPVHR
ncbi:uncharacterized protein LOC127839040 isoform X3 [Dreissena polymorpha]|uniref:uncharacterized protein LOC127839040 isoform X3 n=1 Tax=Dreissena polymorpha TaxID=45954 RepID=UPI002263B6FD|nr:uncharacterized protein LOC127839040 isoform X3 [Dreissena polymorpha]